MIPKDYNDNFYKIHLQNSIDSAREVVPLFLAYFKPKTVLDIGCGIGTWLKVFEQYQCEVYGIDGDYVNPNDLLIAKTKFKPYNLNFKYNLEKKYDLVISLEVAEHILPENAEVFVESMCNHGDVILFSAAIPGQEGTLHYNEQYNKYWVQQFNQNGYRCIDFFREKIWNNEKISWWYRQNILVFIKESEIDNLSPELIPIKKNKFPNTYIHPSLFEYKNQKAIQLDKRVRELEKLVNNPFLLLKHYFNKVKKRIV